jgi:hypothetical protein
VTPPRQGVPLPPGLAVVLDSRTRVLDSRTLCGGSPPRVLRLSRSGALALAELRSGSPSARTLARVLTDAQLAHPRPSAPATAPEVSVLIPVRERAAELDRCLAALGGGYPVLVVDDASSDAAGIARVCARHGARLIRREVNGGPGAARDSGLAVIDTEFVALLDSDCVPAPGWIERLAAHLADPLVAAVAPRITALPPQRNSPLDMGPAEARVVPGTAVSYVPTAALLLRRAALPAGTVFDPALRYGEDVDLV